MYSLLVVSRVILLLKNQSWCIQTFVV